MGGAVEDSARELSGSSIDRPPGECVAEEGAQHDSGAAEEVALQESIKAEVEEVTSAAGDVELVAAEGCSIDASQAVVDALAVADEVAAAKAVAAVEAAAAEAAEAAEAAAAAVAAAAAAEAAAVAEADAAAAAEAEAAAAAEAKAVAAAEAEATAAAEAEAKVAAEAKAATCAEAKVAPAAVRAAGKDILPPHAELEAHGWELVQHCSDQWHEAQQGLGGAAYGTPQGDSPSAPSWAIAFEADIVLEFLFATGDGTKWLTLPAGEVAKLRAAALGSECSLSGARCSLNPQLGSVRALRDTSGELWLGLSSPLVDQRGDGAGLVYGTGAAWASNVRRCGGANVYVRIARERLWDPKITFNDKACFPYL